MSIKTSPIKTPPLKIQGIKTKLVPFILENIKWDGKGQWIEPFLGSGVVAFNLCPHRALLADSNPHIITVYQAIQKGKLTTQNLRNFLEKEGCCLRETEGEYYYVVRERFNQSHSPFDFLFLNRACFNGMMRFNSKGGFNVPFCRKPNRFSKAYITRICNQVAWVTEQMKGKAWSFVVQDWRQTVGAVSTNDFVYLDPPYNDRHANYYQPWDKNDADALAEAVKQLPSGFAYSTWKANQYRVNEHLTRHFADYPVRTKEHFYYLGATEAHRHVMEEALVIAPDYVAE